MREIFFLKIGTLKLKESHHTCIAQVMRLVMIKIILLQLVAGNLWLLVDWICGPMLDAYG